MIAFSVDFASHLTVGYFVAVNVVHHRIKCRGQSIYEEVQFVLSFNFLKAMQFRIS